MEWAMQLFAFTGEISRVRMVEALERMEASVEPPSDVAESAHASELH